MTISAKASVMYRLEIRSGEQSHGFLLVAVLRSEFKPKTFPPKVAFNKEQGKLESSKYRYQFREGQAGLLGQVFLKSNGQEKNLFRGSQFVFNMLLPWYLPDFSLDQSNFHSEIESWQVGPLRTIVAVGVKLKGLFSVLNLHLFSELSFSPQGFQIPTVIEFPFDPKSNFKPGTGIAYGISFAEDLEWQLRSNLEPLPAKSPEDLYKSKTRASNFPYFYALGKSPYGDVLVRVKVDEAAAAQSLPPYIVDDKTDLEAAQEHWPWLEDLKGDVRVFLDISGVPKGSYDFGLDLILADEASEETIASVNALRTHWSGVSHSSRLNDSQN